MPLYTINDLPEGIPKNLTALTSEDDILSISKPLRDQFGITYFAHTISFYDGKTTTLITNHQVAIHWVVNKYAIPGNNHQGNHLPSGYYLVPYMGDLYPKAYRKALLELFDIEHMLLIVDSNKFYSDIFAFAAEPDNFKIMNFYLNNMNILKKFIFYYKEKAKHLIKKTIGECQILPPASKIIGSPLHDEKFLALDLSKEIQLTGHSRLTKREIECLLLASKGKTAKEIAKIIKISPRTVEYHLNNSKDKLNCHFKSELLEKFMHIFDKNILFR